MSEYLKLKVILFDLDDTLLDSKTAEYNAIVSFKKVFNEFNNIDEKSFARMWHSIITELYEKYLEGKISFEQQRVERIKKLFFEVNINVKDDEAKEKFNIYLNLYKENWILFDDAIEVLETLKNNYKLAIITNGDGIQQREKLQKTKIEKYFSEIIISSEIGVAKPDKQIFEVACKNLNIKSQECIMIGDKYKTDVQGAINAGIKAIWVNRKNENIEYEHQIKELKGVLNLCK